MKPFFQLTGVVFLVIGVWTAWTATFFFNWPEKRDSALQNFIFGLVLVASGGTLVGVENHIEQRSKESDRVKTAFLRSLQTWNGQLTVIQFAIAAELEVQAAKTYLEKQAQACQASVDVTPEGHFLYHFGSVELGQQALPDVAEVCESSSQETSA